MATSGERRRDGRDRDRDRTSDAGQNWDYFTNQRFLPEEQGMVGDWKAPQRWHLPLANEDSLGRDPRSFPGPAEGRYAGRGPRSYRRSDTRIHEDACERLTAHPDIDPSEVRLAVADGEITLEGTVDSRATKRLVGRLCEDVPGVRDVHNRLHVAGTAGERRP